MAANSCRHLLKGPHPGADFSWQWTYSLWAPMLVWLCREHQRLTEEHWVVKVKARGKTSSVQKWWQYPLFYWSSHYFQVRQALLLSPICRWESWVWRKLNNLPRVVKVVREWAETETQVWNPNRDFSLYYSAVVQQWTNLQDISSSVFGLKFI